MSLVAVYLELLRELLLPAGGKRAQQRSRVKQVFLNRFKPAEILVLAGGARLKRVQGHGSPVNVCRGDNRITERIVAQRGFRPPETLVHNGDSSTAG